MEKMMRFFDNRVTASEAKRSTMDTLCVIASLEAIQKISFKYCLFAKFHNFANKTTRTMVSNKKGYVYILFNQRNGTLYIGVTSFLKRRVYEHKTRFHPDSFTAKYSVDKLGYYEEHVSIKEAIEREKQIKGGSRAAKLALIEGMNPNWEDLYDLL